MFRKELLFGFADISCLTNPSWGDSLHQINQNHDIYNNVCNEWKHDIQQKPSYEILKNTDLVS